MPPTRMQYSRSGKESLVDLPTEEVLDHLLAMVKYLSSATDKVSQDEVTKTISDVYQNSEGIMHTLADQWKEEGREEGREEGEAVVRETIIRILDSRFDILAQHLEDVHRQLSDRLELCELEELKEMANYALEAFNLDAFLQYLPEEEPEAVSS